MERFEIEKNQEKEDVLKDASLLNYMRRRLLSSALWGTLAVLALIACFLVSPFTNSTRASVILETESVTHELIGDSVKAKPVETTTDSRISDYGHEEPKSELFHGITAPSSSSIPVVDTPANKVYRVSDDSIVPMDVIRGQNNYALVYYYAHWSPSSKKLDRTWQKKAMQAVAPENAAFIATVELDCEVYREYCHSHNITAVPDLRLYVYGRDDTRGWMYNPDGTEYATAQSILVALDQYVGEQFCANSDDQGWSRYTKTPAPIPGPATDDDAFLASLLAKEEEAKRASEGEVNLPDEEEVDHDDAYLSDDEVLTDLWEPTPRATSAAENEFFFFFKLSGCPLCQEFQPVWEQLKLGGFHNVSFREVNCDTDIDAGRLHVECEDIRSTGLPIFRLVKGGVDPLYGVGYDVKSGSSSSMDLFALRSFLAQQLSGIPQPGRYRAPDPRSPHFHQEVVFVPDYQAGKQYQDNVVITFYSSFDDGSCRICPTLWHSWYPFVNYLSSTPGQPQILAERIDCSYHNCPKNQSLPFVRWYHNHRQVGQQLNWNTSMTMDTLLAEKDKFWDLVGEENGQRQLRQKNSLGRRRLNRA